MPQSSGQRSRRRVRTYDPINRVVWAALLMMAGVVLLADQLGKLPSYPNAGAWDWIMLGAGAVLLLAELVRAVSGDYGRPSGWILIAGVALIGVGASAVFGVSMALLWPAALIAVGIVLLARNIAGR
jgi:hypothetical protein